MSNKKILTLAVLGAALVSLAEKAKGTPAETDANALVADFDSYCKQAPELDQAKILELQNENEQLKAEAESHKAGIDKAKEVITSLKGQVEAAESKASQLSPKLTVKIGGVTYVINHGAHPHSAKELSENVEACKEVLKIEGQNAISKLNA